MMSAITRREGTDAPPLTITPSKPSNDERIAIIWFHQGPLGSHAGIVVDDRPYGFEPIGFKSISPSTMETAIGRVLSGKSHAEGVTLLWLKVTAAQKQEILKQCKKNFVLGYTCMNIVSKIIPDEVVKIPTLLSISSDVSLLYLKYLNECGHENLLHFEYVDGPKYEISKFRESVQEKYSTIGMIITSLVISSITSVIFFTLVNFIDHERGKKSLLLAFPIFLATILRIRYLMTTFEIPGKPHLS